MADQQIALNLAMNNPAELPAMLEDERSPYAYTEAYIDELMAEYQAFQTHTQRQLELYARALQNLTEDMHNDLYTRIAGKNASSFDRSLILNSWHSTGRSAVHQVRYGLDDMLTAMREGKAFARAMQRTAEGGSHE